MLQRPFGVILAMALCTAVPLLPAPRSGLAGDCDGDWQVSIGEVQKAINMFLGTLAPSCGVDGSADGTVSIGEVQRVINGFLGLIPLHTLQASAGPGGTVEPSGAILAAQGTSQTFSVKPELGMAVEDLLVDGSSAGSLNSFTFEDIQEDHTLHASFTALCQGPQITQPPLSVEIAHGAIATLSVEASGTEPLIYRWYRGESGDEGHPIPDATQAAYTTPPLTETTPYWVMVTNACGSADSPTATVVVAPAPLHLLTVSLGGGVSGMPSASGSYAEGAVVPYAYEALGCFGNLAVLLDGVPAGAEGTVTMDGPHTLAATAAPLAYTVEASAGAGGSIAPAGAVPAACGTDATFAMTPEDGHQILDVLVDGVSAGAVATHTFPHVTADHTIAASFTALPTYTLMVSLGEGVAGTPSSTGSYAQGSVVNFAYAPASECYEGLDVRLDGSPVPHSGSVTMDSDRALSATAARKSHTIAASAGTGGTIDPSGTVPVQCGADRTFTVSPASGHAILDVKVDGTSVGTVSSYTFFDVRADHTILANFEANTYTVTFLAGPGGTLSGTTPQTVQHGGSTTPVTAVPDADYLFINWTGTGGFTSSAKTLTVTNITGDMTLTANFALDPEVQKDAEAQAFVGSIPQSKDPDSPTPWYDPTVNRYSFTVLGKTNTHDRDDGSGEMYAPATVIKPWLEGLLVASLPSGDYDGDGVSNSADPTPLGF